MTNHYYLLTDEEVHAVDDVRVSLGDLDSNECCDPIMLGPVPVISEDGTELLGFLVQDDDLNWSFTRDREAHVKPLPPERTTIPDEEDCD